tara:strand:+ start:5479 stop:8214 length:2736 start_codon:yes stop_codon:yes gene_type:complete
VKTFLEETVTEIIKSHSNIDELTIVLPSRRAGVFFKDTLTAQLKAPLLAPKIFSIQEFIEEISTLRLAPNLTVLIEFYNIYCNHTPKEYIDSFDEFTRWAPALLKDFSDLDTYLVDVSSAFEFLNSYYEIGTFLEDESKYMRQQFFWKTLHHYFELYKTSLYSKGIGTLGMLFREAVDSVEIYLQNTKAFHYFVGFNALNTAEINLLQSFLESQRAKIFWDIDHFFYQDQQHASSRFIQKYHREWTYFRQKAKPIFPKNFEQVKNIKIIGIPKNVGQAKYAGSLLKDSISDSKTNSKTALVLGNETLLIPILSGLPQDVTHWNVTMGYPLLNSPVASFFNHLFEMHIKASPSGFLYQDVVRILRFDWVQNILKTKSKKDSNFLDSLFNSNKFFIVREDIKPLLDHPIGILIFSSFESGIDFLEKILSFTYEIQKYFMKEKRLEYEMYPTYFNLVEESLLHLLNMGDTLKSINTIQGIHFLWNELITTQSLDYMGNPIESVQIMGMLETRVLDFDTIILTNVNEGILPAGRSNQSIFPFEIKKKFGLPTFLDNDAIYTYHFYRLLQRASNITLLYNTESDGLYSGEPSRFIHQLRFFGLDQHNITEEVVSAPAKSFTPEKLEVLKSPEIIRILNEKAHSGFSPSSLGVYLIDPLQFYKEKILGVREQVFFDNALSLMESGTIVHDTLEELYSPYVGKPMQLEYYKDLEQQIAPLLLKHYRKVFGGDKKIFGKNLLMLNALEQSILKLFSIEKHKIQNGDSLTILDLEKEFEYPLDVPVIGKIILKGKIDRIDRFNGVFRIVDYKLGKIDVPKLKISDWENIRGDIKRLALFQILLYAYVNKQILINESSIQAGIISFKSIDQYLVPFGYKKDGKSGISKEIDAGVLNSFEQFLITLIKEIFDSSKPFAALEN